MLQAVQTIGGYIMKLYHATRAPNPERVSFFLRAKGRLGDVEIEEISIMKQEHKGEAYRKISPFAQVPCLVLDDGRTLTESQAICQYFEALWPEPNLLGSDAYEIGEIEMWSRRIELMWFMPFAMWFRNTHEMMAPLEVPQSAEQAAKGEKTAKYFAKKVDQHLASHEFMAAGRFTNADILTYIACGFAAVMGWKPHIELEHLGSWRTRMKEQGFAG